MDPAKSRSPRRSRSPLPSRCSRNAAACGHTSACSEPPQSSDVAAQNIVHLQVSDLSGRFTRIVTLPSPLPDVRGTRQKLSAILHVPAHTLRLGATAVGATPETWVVSTFNFVQRATCLYHSDVYRKLYEEGVEHAHFHCNVCEICRDAESDRDISWAREEASCEDPIFEFGPGKTCKCEWTVQICDQCLVRNNDNVVVCPRCVDLNRIHVRHHSWLVNMVFFRDSFEELEKNGDFKGYASMRVRSRNNSSAVPATVSMSFCSRDVALSSVSRFKRGSMIVKN